MNDFRMNTEYRFYHCYQKPSSIICYPVDNAHTLPSNPADSRLLFVPKYLPEILDTIVLNYQYYRSVRIEKSAGVKRPFI